MAVDSPLFETADIWTKKRDFFWFSHDSIQEWIDSEKEYWEKAPQKYADKKYADNEYYQLYKLPREQWGSRVENYLQIGSDYGAGISKLGICLNEIGQDNPPVYILMEDCPKELFQTVPMDYSHLDLPRPKYGFPWEK